MNSVKVGPDYRVQDPNQGGFNSQKAPDAINLGTSINHAPMSAMLRARARH